MEMVEAILKESFRLTCILAIPYMVILLLTPKFREGMKRRYRQRRHEYQLKEAQQKKRERKQKYKRERN